MVTKTKGIRTNDHKNPTGPRNVNYLKILIFNCNCFDWRTNIPSDRPPNPTVPRCAFLC